MRGPMRRQRTIKRGTVSSDALARATEGRAVTLILGAGVSRSRGVPTWIELTRELWRQSELPVPTWLEDKSAVLSDIRAEVAAKHGKDIASRVTLTRPHPLAEQMALELLEVHFNGERKVSPNGFTDRLRTALYPQQVTRSEADTLGVLVRLLREQQRQPNRRVLRVISFNADDHLETEANEGHHSGRDPVLWPIARESSHVRYSRGAHGLAPIPVYHPHGFLPRHPGRSYQEAADTLVFTDAQYWASMASPLSFANRVIANALHDSVCIFIGLSMFDVNLIRWLGIRYHAICMDRKSQQESLRHSGHGSELDQRKAERASLERHYWVRLRAEDRDDLLPAILRKRGVSTVEIEHWGEPFERLIDACFKAATPSV